MKIYSHIANSRSSLILLISIVHFDLHACVNDGHINVINKSGEEVVIQRYNTNVSKNFIENYHHFTLKNGEKKQVCWLWEKDKLPLQGIGNIKFSIMKQVTIYAPGPSVKTRPYFQKKRTVSNIACKTHVTQKASGITGQINHCEHYQSDRYDSQRFSQLQLASNNCGGTPKKACEITLKSSR